MAAPIPTFSSDNVSTGFTEQGSPLYVDDQHNPKSALNADGNDDVLTRAAVALSGDDDVSFAFWMNTAEAGDLILVMAQANSAGVGDTMWRCQIRTTGRITVFADGAAGGFRQSRSDLNKSDGAYHHIVGTIKNGASTAADINIFIDKVETSYAAQDAIFGGGFDSFITTEVVTLGGFADSTKEFEGIISRPRIWKDTVLTLAQVQEIYDDEVEAIGEGFGSLIGGAGRHNIRESLSRQLRYNRGIQRIIR